MREVSCKNTKTQLARARGASVETEIRQLCDRIFCETPAHFNVGGIHSQRAAKTKIERTNPTVSPGAGTKTPDFIEFASITTDASAFDNGCDHLADSQGIKRQKS